MLNKFERHIREIITLEEEEFPAIAAYFSAQKYKKGELLIRQGDKVQHTFFVVKGLLKLTFIDKSGKEHILSFAQEDWWESDYAAFFNGTSATMSLKCLEDTEVLSISLKNVHQLYSSFPKMEHFFLHKANNGHIASQQRILSLLSSSAEERYNQLLRLYPTLPHRVSKTQLAAYLGVSRETLSRLYQS